jgi:hypothetical protein
MFQPNFTQVLFPRQSFVFGAGSSGSEILKYVVLYLASVLDMKQSRFVQFLALDADKPERYTGKALAREKRFQCYYERLDDLLRNAPQLEYIVEQLNPEYLSLDPPFIRSKTAEGAGAIPLAGLLSFLSRRGCFQRKLRAMDNAVEAQCTLKQEVADRYILNPVDAHPLVIVVGSRCGGAGAGMTFELLRCTMRRDF